MEIVGDGVNFRTYEGGEVKPELGGDLPTFSLVDNRKNDRAPFKFFLDDVADVTAINIDGVAQALPASLTDFYDTYKSYFF